jgi:hypothetical protein
MKGETECVYIQKLIDVVVADSNIHHGGVGVTYLLHTTALPQLVLARLVFGLCTYTVHRPHSGGRQGVEIYISHLQDTLLMLFTY